MWCDLRSAPAHGFITFYPRLSPWAKVKQGHIHFARPECWALWLPPTAPILRDKINKAWNQFSIKPDCGPSIVWQRHTILGLGPPPCRGFSACREDSEGRCGKSWHKNTSHTVLEKSTFFLTLSICRDFFTFSQSKQILVPIVYKSYVENNSLITSCYVWSWATVFEQLCSQIKLALQVTVQYISLQRKTKDVDNSSGYWLEKVQTFKNGSLIITINRAV